MTSGGGSTGHNSMEAVTTDQSERSTLEASCPLHAAPDDKRVNRLSVPFKSRTNTSEINHSDTLQDLKSPNEPIDFVFTSKMAPRKNVRDRPATPTPPIIAQEPAPAAPTPIKMKSSLSSSTSSSRSSRANWDDVLLNIYQHYTKETPQRTKLIDVFLLFLVVVGALQFLYCVLAGNYVRTFP